MHTRGRYPKDNFSLKWLKVGNDYQEQRGAGDTGELSDDLNISRCCNRLWSGGLEGAWHWERAELCRALHPGCSHKQALDGKLGMPLLLLVNTIVLDLLSGVGMGGSAQLLSIW